MTILEAVAEGLDLKHANENARSKIILMLGKLILN